MMLLSASEMQVALEAGDTTSQDLVGAALERLADPSGEGVRTFTASLADEAMVESRAADMARGAGHVSALTGVPVSVKCLFDIKGLVTTAGSTVLANRAPAQADAIVVQRLRRAGAVIVGHTNMTEFAYSGLGINPHYGTPANPADRSRIPGGSSSGAAVSVGDGMAAIGIGTDTGGSCRIPAAFCGLVGWKPTARRVPQAGSYPLSRSLDSIGCIARSVADCEATDAIMAGEPLESLPLPLIGDLKLAVLDNYVLDDLSPHVAQAYRWATSHLERRGAKIVGLSIPDLDALPELNARGGIIAAEALGVHEDLLALHEAEYDQRVSRRIRRAEQQSPGEYGMLLQTRARMIAVAESLMAEFDAVLMPTVAVEAPTLLECAEEASYGKLNLLALRNTTVANFLDGCAISVPLPVNGLPVGLMLMGRPMSDRRLFAVAGAVELALRS